MNVFVRFDAIPSMTLQDINELCTYKSHKELQREITPIVLAPSPLIFISIIFLVHMYVFAKFDKIPPMILQNIKETKCYRHTHARSEGQTGNVKTVYPHANTVYMGYKNIYFSVNFLKYI